MSDQKKQTFEVLVRLDIEKQYFVEAESEDAAQSAALDKASEKYPECDEAHVTMCWPEEVEEEEDVDEKGT